MRALVTGGAGFIGSHLTEALLKENWDVTILDNLTDGRSSNIPEELLARTTLIVGDCTGSVDVGRALTGVDIVFHLAANSEVRTELNNASNCYQQNAFGTYVLLHEMRKSGAQQIIFASSSTVYGEASEIPTPETYEPLRPISVYGMSKLIAESLVSLTCHEFQKKATILRLANIVGRRSHRGVIRDFISKLHNNRKKLEILGDGKQSKSYLHVEDCVKAILSAIAIEDESVRVFNVGSTDQISVTDVASLVVEELGLADVEFNYTGGVEGGRGWEGDVRSMLLDVGKLHRLGWSPHLNSREAVGLATRELIKELG